MKLKIQSLFGAAVVGATVLLASVEAGAQQQTTAPANLAVMKEATSPTLSSGASELFVVTIANTGPETAFGTILTDTLPPGSTVTSASVSLDQESTQCEVINDVVICPAGDLQPGETAVATIEATIVGSGAVINTAVARHSGPDPDPTNDADSATVLVAGETSPTTSLVITKSDTPDPVESGSLLTFLITVANEGPEDASGVIVSDTLPSGTTFVSSDNGGVTVTSGVLTLPIGTLPAGSSESFQVTVRADNPGRIANTAAISATEPSSNPNNTVREFSTVTRDGTVVGNGNVVDLVLTKTDSPDPVQVEEPLAFNITVTNASLTSATGILVTDELPDEVAFESAETSGSGTCSRNGQTVTCTLGELGAGETTTVQIIVRPLQTGTITNTATVSSNETEANNANNSDTEQTTVLPDPNRQSDLSIIKTTQDTQTTEGETVTFNIDVFNNGPDTANMVIVTDTLPANSTFVSATPSQGACQRSGNTLTCNLGTLAPGQGENIQVVVLAESEGTLTNTANVRSNSADPNGANNTSTASSTVNRRDGSGTACPDLTIVTTRDATSRCRGGQRGTRCNVRTQVVVSNIGNAPAEKTFVCFFLSTDTVLDQNDQLLGFKRVRKLRPNSSDTVRFRGRVPFGVDPVGMFIIAEADCGDNLFPECSEQNNTTVSGPITPRVRRNNNDDY